MRMIPSKSTAIILVDEVMLYQGKDTTQKDFTDACSALCELSDMCLFDNDSCGCIPFITSLHYSYCSQFTTATQRPIRLFVVDAISVKYIMPVFEATLKGKFDDKTVICLISMCLGHARSIDKVYRCLCRSGGFSQFSHLLTLIYNDLRATRIFAHIGDSILVLAPALQDLPVASAPHTVGDGSDEENVVIDGSKMVHDGTYFNSFKAVANTKSFIPTVTLWHLFAVCHDVTPSGDQHDWKESLFQLISSFAFTTKTSYETFISRALHIRLEALSCMQQNPQSIFGFRSFPVPFVAVSSSNLMRKTRPLIPISSEGRIFVPLSHQIRQWKIVQSENIYHVRTHTFPSGFFDDPNSEILMWYFLHNYACVIRPTNSINVGVDIGMHIWCCNDVLGGPLNVFGVNLLLQDKIGKKDLSQPQKLRFYLDKMQKEADILAEHYTRTGQTNEHIVLCVSCYGIDGLPNFMETQLLAKDAYYSKLTFQSIRYPVIFLDNDVTALLGKSLQGFFDQLFQWREDEAT